MLETGRKAETSFGFKPRWSLCNRKRNNEKQTKCFQSGFTFQEVCVEPKWEPNPVQVLADAFAAKL